MNASFPHDILSQYVPKHARRDEFRGLDPRFDWRVDRLGSDFFATTLELGPDPYGEGEVCGTVVRHRPKNRPDNKRCILYVHGMTDYFFQVHVAEFFTANGYDFAALDLRKCGRSYRHGQTHHHCRSLTDYFPELNITLDMLRVEYDEIVIASHSTGGIITAIWVDALRRGAEAGDPEAVERYDSIVAAFMNSPWLDLMVPPRLLAGSHKLAEVCSKVMPDNIIPGKHLGVYTSTLHASAQGEWNFDLSLKPLQGFPMSWGWMNSILEGHRRLHQGYVNMGKPVFVMCSTVSRLNKPFTIDSHYADCVLDVAQIRQWAPALSDTVELMSIPGARHDVYLSVPEVRESALNLTLNWLNEELGAPEKTAHNSEHTDE